MINDLRAARLIEAKRRWIEDETPRREVEHLADLYESNWTPPEPAARRPDHFVDADDMVGRPALTHDQALLDLRALADKQVAGAIDVEAHHMEADDILTAFLRHLGYREVADAFDDIRKWYA